MTSARQKIKAKVLRVCAKRLITLKEFLFQADVPFLRWYKFMNGQVPSFETVCLLIKSADNMLEFEDFEEIFEEKLINPVEAIEEKI